MRRPRMRPTFDLVLSIPGETLFERVRMRLAEGDGSISGVVGRRQAELTTGRANRHFWSPMLVLEVDGREDGVRVLHGRFAPHPSVWMGFMAAYGMLFISAVASAVYGVSQRILGQTPWGHEREGEAQDALGWRAVRLTQGKPNGTTVARQRSR